MTHWQLVGAVQVCGREGTGTVLYDHLRIFQDNEVATDRLVLPETTGKVTRILQKGNTENTVKYPGSVSGRPLNMQEHDYLRSTRQGQVDLCQHFHSASSLWSGWRVIRTIPK